MLTSIQRQPADNLTELSEARENIIGPVSTLTAIRVTYREVEAR